MSKSGILLAVLVAAVSASIIRPETRNNYETCPPEYPKPTTCDPATCLPSKNCACARANPPIAIKETPQIVYMSFDDGLTNLAHEQFYKRLFGGDFLNPNGCPIRATHFITHLSTDYTLVNHYYNQGHEIAIHSITHRFNTSYWQTMSALEWEKEIVAMRDMVVRFSGVPKSEITGVRVPYLQSGGDAQFAMMAANNFTYDCSRPTVVFGFNHLDQGVWPFTMDYEAKLDCQITPCPKCSFPGVWEQPMLSLEDDRIGQCGVEGVGCPCSMLDSCIIEGGAEEVKKMLMRNFDLAYNGKTRAPIGLFVHAAWFFGAEHRFEGYMNFLKEILAKDDVWVLPVNAGIQYLKDPKTNQQLLNGEHPSFTCDLPAEVDCSFQTNCQYQAYEPPDIYNQTLYMKICDFSCPSNYPWLNNPEGN